MKGLRVFLVSVAGVALVKHLAKKAADSAFTLGFLSLSAVNKSSVIASRVVYKYYGYVRCEIDRWQRKLSVLFRYIIAIQQQRF